MLLIDALVMDNKVGEILKPEPDAIPFRSSVADGVGIHSDGHPSHAAQDAEQGAGADAQQVAEHARDKGSVLVVLDSNHTHEHVLKELEIYARHVTRDSYIVVFDTLIEDMPGDLVKDRPWGIGNNPKTRGRC